MKERIDELAELMNEFNLREARVKDGDFEIEFSRDVPTKGAVAIGAVPAAATSDEAKPAAKPKAPKAPAAPVGTPVTSPMMGIYYGAPSPGSPPFVKEGDSVTSGQVVGLIEAMKVFNEITCTASGVVKKVMVESGQLVQPGDVLLYVG
jgi:acetyl-CoA carboxylase biotin carboxyl carrier protein